MLGLMRLAVLELGMPGPEAAVDEGQQVCRKHREPLRDGQT